MDDVKTSEKVVCTLMAVVAMCLYILICQIVPRFLETFASFGLELPIVTRILTNVHQMFAALALLSLLPLLIWFKGRFVITTKTFMLAASVINVLIACAFLIITLYAMYAPLFHLGKG